MNSELLVRMVNSQVDPVIRDAFIVKLVVSFWGRSYEIVKGTFYRFVRAGSGIFTFRIKITTALYGSHRMFAFITHISANK